MKYPSPPGVFDILPQSPQELWRTSSIWQYIEGVLRATAVLYGFEEIRTPVIERTELFLRSVGETSDIVSKEMYTFDDKGGRSLSLRPEGTAAVMRAYIEGQMQNLRAMHKLYYISPMFRYDRPQAGRYRQHHQFGVEVVGVKAPEQDVELIDMACSIYRKLGLTQLTVYVNSIGDSSTREAFREALKNYLRPNFEQLSEDSQKRFEQNPLRILDSKDPTDKQFCLGAPAILDFLSPESRDYFERVKALLTRLNIKYEVNTSLVRGLDYYNETVFEIVCGELGAQNSLCGGGRFDGLLKTLGGPDLPTVGFAFGLERVIQTMLLQGVSIPSAPRPTLFLIALGDEGRERCFTLVHQLREEGVAAQMDFSGRKLGKVMAYADQICARFVGVVGEQELASGSVDIKEMISGKTQKMPFEELTQLGKNSGHWTVCTK